MNAIYGTDTDFTSDDTLWVGKPPIEQLFSVIYDPVKWAYDHVTVTRKDGTVRPATILRNYSISYVATDPDTGADPRLFTVQGIDQTNILTIRMPASGAGWYIYDRLLSEWTYPIPHPHDPNVSIYLAYKAYELMNQGSYPPPTTIQEASAQIFHGRDIALTVCDKCKAFAHMPLIRDEDVHRLHGDLDLARALKVALYHLFAAAYPPTVEESFKQGILAPTDLRYRRWNEGASQWDHDAPDHIDYKKCFHGKIPQPPMTITGYSSFEPGEERRPGYTMQPAAPNAQETCEVLVAEYEAATFGVTWTDAFSKTYAGG